MAQGYSAFITYFFESVGGVAKTIHCNYIKQILLDTDTPEIEELKLVFSDVNDFKFLSDDISAGTGFTANHIYALVQIVNNSGHTDISQVRPDSAKWKLLDLTDQIPSHIVGAPLNGAKLTSVVFKIPLNLYMTMADYNLSYLNYPASTEPNRLSFGDETYFLGNVSTDIEATVYTTDLSINLLLNEFNTSTNPTWDGSESVSISEIGIYDENKNLVAIGKLNNPITKDSTIARTIVFAIDF